MHALSDLATNGTRGVILARWHGGARCANCTGPHHIKPMTIACIKLLEYRDAA